MIPRNRVFTRVEPDRSSQKIYVFCEGKNREYNYFKYFVEIDQHLNLIVYELQGEENNSPNGLYTLAITSLIKSESNLNPRYDYRAGFDKVWIVVDTDKDKEESRKKQLIDIRQQCLVQNWSVAQSNPCFEVWLYYHQENQKPDFENIEVSAKWKTFVGEVIIGGFDPRKHPVLIQTAIINSAANFQQNHDGFPDIATTEVFRLAQNILSIGSIKEKIDKGL